MSSLVKAIKVTFDQDSMWVELSDGRMLGVPLAWFPRLLRATRAQLRLCRLAAEGFIGRLWMKTYPSRDCSPDAATKPDLR
jgi:hypothetical protein